MDWKRFDRARRSVGPVELDLVEAYAQGRINRRAFVRRGTVIGLSLPFLGAVIAACGDDDDTASTTGGGSDTTPGTAGATTPGTATGTTGGIMTISNQVSSGPLDPINMQDLGTYNLIAQSFEFLVGLGADGNIGQTGLAESWSPNEAGDVWTFNLRQGVMWQDGTPFTSADVAATFDRLVAANNAGIAGVFDTGAVDATDPNVAVVSLLAPNGNFPYLISVFNAQTPITPVAFETGSTLDGAPNGTGPWVLESYDPSRGANFVRNENYWGPAPLLDGVFYQVFEDVGTAVTAMQSGAIDAVQQFSVIGGDALLNSTTFTVLTPPAATHRQVWMRCTDDSQFGDKRVRQALALCFNRQSMVDTLFQGRAVIANDHPVADFNPFFDPDAVPQREFDPEQARQLLTDAGFPDGVTATLHAGQNQEIPDLAAIIAADAQAGGFTLQVQVESQETFYGAQWCPAEPADPPCSGASELGIVDYGHRPVPDLYFNAALKTGGVWNSSQYMNPAFDDLFAQYSSAVGVDAQRDAIGQMQALLNDEVPIGLPYFYNYLSGHSNAISGMQVTALGHTFVGAASKG